MFRLGNLLSRFWNIFRKQRLEQDLNSELQAHLDLLAEENIRRGMDPKEAAHAARREFGGLEQTKEQYRERRSLPFLETLLQDVRYGLRMLAQPLSTKRRRIRIGLREMRLAGAFGSARNTEGARPSLASRPTMLR